VNLIICIHCDRSLVLHESEPLRRVEEAAAADWVVRFVPESGPWGGRCPECALEHLEHAPVGECDDCGELAVRSEITPHEGAYLCAVCYSEREDESQRAFERAHGPEVAL
jgi:hypothetical protein